MSFTVKVLAQLDLLKNLLRTKAYKNDVQHLKKELDEKVVKLHLPALNAELTVLTHIKPQVDRFVFPDVHRTVFAQEHADYIGIKVEGRFSQRFGFSRHCPGDTPHSCAGGTSHEKFPHQRQLMD